jgi:predicted PurR-regulated permease PerM
VGAATHDAPTCHHLHPPATPVTTYDQKALVRYAVVAVMLAAALGWTLYLVRDALLIIYISALIAIGFSPIVEAAEHRSAGWRYRLPRWAAILGIYCCILGILVGVGLLVFPPLVQQTRALWTALPSLIERGQEWLIARGILQPGTSPTDVIRQSPVGGSDAVSTVVSAVSGLIGGIFGAVTILILSFYMLTDSRQIVHAFVRLFPRNERPRVEDACHRVTTKVSAWLGGQLLLAGIIGVTAAIGLWLLDIPYFYVLALIAGVGEMIPVVGPVLSAIPAVAVAVATTSPTRALFVILFFFLQQQLENHILVPKIMARQVGVSPVFVISALLIGGSLLGVMGAILAVPTAAILQVLLEEWASGENGNSVDQRHEAEDRR